MSARVMLGAGAFAVALAIAFRWSTGGPELAADDTRSYAGSTPAPEFPGELDWLNTGGRRLSLEELRGKVVLLDFWTYGCINCMHVIPDLERLEEKYPRELVVIGVHSAKFENEGETENIRRIVQRYELRHPVVNDREFEIWRAYGATAWPTLALIDPDGKLIGSVAGEGHYELLDKVIGRVIDEFDGSGKIDRTIVEFTTESAAVPDRPLRFPGKVLADAETARLFIADSNHNRIVIASLDGEVRQVIGNGEAALRDGAFERAAFFRPQGMCLAGADTLYVADTGNHALRRVDLAARTVETLAGTGEQGYLAQSAAPARGTRLNSPWDVLCRAGVVYIAMAGQHQIWSYEPASETLREFAGSRREELRDGKRLEAGLNQPSGLATDGERLYIADSEASAIRAAGFGPEDRLYTIVGTGLFDFGDRDGTGEQVRLQHPLGLVFHEGVLYVADTYNSKIKRIDPERRRSETFAGGDGGLDEPGGLAIAGSTLYIADTNHHRIRTASLMTGELADLPLRDEDGVLR